jgi:hypothetical protein
MKPLWRRQLSFGRRFVVKLSGVRKMAARLDNATLGGLRLPDPSGRAAPSVVPTGKIARMLSFVVTLTPDGRPS